MPGKTIGIMMNVGYAGSQSRSADAIIQARAAAGTIAFGQAVVLTNDNKWQLVGADTTADQVAGVAFREVVQANTFNPQSNPDYLEDNICDVMTRGNMTVHCQRGTPVSGQPVYVRIVANETYPDAQVAFFEAAADGANTIQVPNIEWTTGVMDGNNVAEITIKTRQKG